MYFLLIYSKMLLIAKSVDRIFLIIILDIQNGENLPKKLEEKGYDKNLLNSAIKRRKKVQKWYVNYDSKLLFL